MRKETTSGGILLFMQELGSRIKEPLKIYLTGGSTCVLKGWRNSTVDIDIKPVPDLGQVYDVIAQLKEKLSLNIELAAPDQFLPALPDWENRSEFIDSFGKVSFYHYDTYSQALSKIARGFDKDLDDARKMMIDGDPDKLRKLFEAIRPQLVRYPALDEKALSRKVDHFIQSFRSGNT